MILFTRIARFWANLSKYFLAITFAGLLTWVFPGVAQAQVQRSMINQSFEDPVIGALPCYATIREDLVPGWNTSHTKIGNPSGSCLSVKPGGSLTGGSGGFVEFWRSGEGGVFASDGSQFVELNANESSRLFQTVCLVNGETFNWRFSHRARGNGNETLSFNISPTSKPAGLPADSTTTEIVSDVVKKADGWKKRSGSFTYTGDSGLQTLGFRSSDAGSSGNFLDDVQIELGPYVEFQPAEGSGAESIATANLPTLRLAGTLTKPLTVTVSVSGTATLGKDFTTPNGTNKFTVDIPAGDYDGTNGVPTGIKVTNDTDIEPNETILLTIEPNSAAYTLASTTSCGGKSTTTTKYTILDDDVRITVKKQLTGNRVNATDQFVLSVADANNFDLVNITTTGTGTTANGVASANVVGGAKYFVKEGPASTVSPSYVVESYGCVNANADSTTVLPSGKNKNVVDITPIGGDDITCTFRNAPPLYAMTLAKIITSGDLYSNVGDKITYNYTITNSGNVTITDTIGIGDDKIASVSCPPLPATGFLPNTALVCSASYTVVQADLDANKVTNTAVAATSKFSSPKVSATAYRLPVMGLDIKITPDPYSAVGEKIVYKYTVTNTGNVTITKPIVVTDDKYTVKCDPLPAGGLAPKATLTCTAEYTIKQDDLDTGKIVNTATATSQGVPPSVPTTAIALAKQTPGLTLEKKVAGGTKTYAAVGEKITYEYKVTNSGNVTITRPVSVSDDKITTVTCPSLPSPPTVKGSVTDGKLAPGGTLTCTADYSVTQADIDAGKVVNTASATDGTTKSPEVSVTATATQAAALKLEKSISAGSPFKAVGDKISYAYKVTNSGNVTITRPISISDDKIKSVTCPALTDGKLAPGGTLTCTADYSVTQADIDAGKVVNTASATDGTTKSPEASATATATQAA
ncbi:conserved repeat domain-containing protein, partial [Phyllobacterium sp. YR620]